MLTRRAISKAAAFTARVSTGLLRSVAQVIRLSLLGPVDESTQRQSLIIIIVIIIFSIIIG